MVQLMVPSMRTTSHVDCTIKTEQSRRTINPNSSRAVAVTGMVSIEIGKTKIKTKKFEAKTISESAASATTNSRSPEHTNTIMMPQVKRLKHTQLYLFLLLVLVVHFAWLGHRHCLCGAYRAFFLASSAGLAVLRASEMTPEALSSSLLLKSPLP